MRVTVVSTAMKTDTARMVGSAVMVDSAASTSTTSAPMLPPAASPSKRTRSTLSHTTSNVERQRQRDW